MLYLPSYYIHYAWPISALTAISIGLLKFKINLLKKFNSKQLNKFLGTITLFFGIINVLGWIEKTITGHKIINISFSHPILTAITWIVTSISTLLLGFLLLTNDTAEKHINKQHLALLYLIIGLFGIYSFIIYVLLTFNP